MRVAVIDHGFVRVARERVYELVSDPSGYPAWWPRVRAAGEGRIDLPVIGPVAYRTQGVHEDVGLLVPIEGPRVEGHLQWHLNEFQDGTIVHVATDVETRRRWSARRVLRHRSSIRRALLELKTRLE